MIPYFPKQITNKAITVYMVALIVISLVFYSYAIPLVYIFLGITFVTGFFLLVNRFTQDWRSVKANAFEGRLFTLAILLRLVWVVVSYFYYIYATRSPFGFENADAPGYHETAVWFTQIGLADTLKYLFGPEAQQSLGDAGYPLFLFVIYEVFGPNVFVARIIKALISAFTSILIYRIGTRTFGKDVGSMAGVMCALMPNFIVYCGYHLKETEMLFLEVAFLERLDYLMRSQKINFWTILFPTLLGGSLFLFRTVLGAAAVFSAATTVLISSFPRLKRGGRRFALIAWGILCLLVAGGGTIATELEGYWEERDENASSKRLEQTLRGNQWAKYATGTVMAPMAFVLPFSTMVNVDQQYGQQEKHGGNFIRNFMGFFVLLGIYEAFRRKKWRDYTMIGAFVISYLGVVALSGFSNSERFLLPGLPCLIMMWAYGISVLRRQTYKLLTPWCFVVFAMEFGWAFFKLGSRSLF